MILLTALPRSRHRTNTPLVVHVKQLFLQERRHPVLMRAKMAAALYSIAAVSSTPAAWKNSRCQTGRDKGVKDFLEQQTRMPEYLNSVFDIVDIAVEDYMRRGFESLMISFGCTGGQHRSVYAADALARHLRNKFKVKHPAEAPCTGCQELG